MTNPTTPLSIGERGAGGRRGGGGGRGAPLTAEGLYFAATKIFAASTLKSRHGLQAAEEGQGQLINNYTDCAEQRKQNRCRF